MAGLQFEKDFGYDAGNDLTGQQYIDNNIPSVLKVDPNTLVTNQEAAEIIHSKIGLEGYGSPYV